MTKNSLKNIWKWKISLISLAVILAILIVFTEVNLYFSERVIGNPEQIVVIKDAEVPLVNRKVHGILLPEPQVQNIESKADCFIGETYLNKGIVSVSLSKKKQWH
jgi:hypothetical protein